MPKRIQRQRTKGWKMPPNTVYVGRPTKWGNPFTLKAYLEAGYTDALMGTQVCVEAYRAWLKGNHHWAHGSPMPAPPNPLELRGKDLACWCGEYDRCHADVLLELANACQPHDEER
jgi:hypothetical protein